MAIGVTNAQTIFIDYMNRAFHSYLDMFVVIFIDDILIYSWDPQEHVENLKIGFSLLQEKKHFSKFSKFEFWMSEVRFLNH